MRSKKQYGTEAGSKVEQVVHEFQKDTLRSGGSGKKVTSRKQAIAIGLSEARRAGIRVPIAHDEEELNAREWTTA
ncbi:MAG: DUF6496 domain-containing protein [Planctomycetota bacterium]|nr:DUF6496 domain-containing protein [Planctomycetota bacterium]